MNIYSISGSVPGKPGFPLRLLWGLLGKRTPRGHDLILTATLRDRHRRPDARCSTYGRREGSEHHSTPQPKSQGQSWWHLRLGPQPELAGGREHLPHPGPACPIRDPPVTAPGLVLIRVDPGTTF